MSKTKTKPRKNAAALTPFRKLIDSKKGERSYVEMAEACGVSRAFLYVMMTGRFAANDEIVESTAKGLGVSKRTVSDALRKTREAYELTV